MLENQEERRAKTVSGRKALVRQKFCCALLTYICVCTSMYTLNQILHLLLLLDCWRRDRTCRICYLQHYICGGEEKAWKHVSVFSSTFIYDLMNRLNFIFGLIPSFSRSLWLALWYNNKRETKREKGFVKM